MTEETRDWVRVYRGPLMGAVAVSLVLGLWLLHEVARSRESRRDHLRWVGSEVHRALSLAVLDDREDRRDELLSRLDQNPSPVAWVRIERGGETLTGVGRAISTQKRERSPGEMEAEGQLILWARAGEVRYLPATGGPGRGRARGGPDHRPPPRERRPGLEFLGELPWEGLGSASRVKPDETVIVLGMKMEAGFLGLVGRPRGPIFLFFLVASTAAGVLLAWALGVRSRLLEAALDRSRSERNHLEEFGLTAAGLAHETKNPLGIILGLAQRISRHPEDPEKVREMAVQIQDAADRATARLGEFLSFARLEEPRLALRDGREILERAVEALRPDFEERRVALALETDHLEFLCDAEMTTQVVVNLLLNALHACEPGGRVVVRLERVGSRVGRLRVLDNGKGIPEELRDRVFQPYVTGSSEGHGLGLAIVSRIARAHGWQVELLSSPGSGTTVTIEGLRGDQE